MTPDPETPEGESGADLRDRDGDSDAHARRATVRVRWADCDAAALAAASVAPDNTDEMATTVDGATVSTVVERSTTGGLRTTLDDYVTNLQVAQQLIDTTDTS